MPQVSIHPRLPVGILTDSDERFSELAAAIGEPCVRLVEPLNDESRSRVSDVLVDPRAFSSSRKTPERRRASRRRESGRFLSRGRLVIYQCPEPID